MRYRQAQRNGRNVLLFYYQPVEQFHQKMDKQKAWCEMAEVTATPTMLLNGYRLPDLYQLPDLKYMLE